MSSQLPTGPQARHKRLQCLATNWATPHCGHLSRSRSTSDCFSEMGSCIEFDSQDQAYLRFWAKARQPSKSRSRTQITYFLISSRIILALAIFCMGSVGLCSTFCRKLLSTERRARMIYLEPVSRLWDCVFGMPVRISGSAATNLDRGMTASAPAFSAAVAKSLSTWAQ